MGSGNAEIYLSCQNGTFSKYGAFCPFFRHLLCLWAILLIYVLRIETSSSFWKKVRMLSSDSILNELGIRRSGKKHRNQSMLSSALFFQCSKRGKKRSKLDPALCTAIYGMVHPLLFTEAMQRVVWKPDDFPGM